MADHNKPTLADSYANWPALLAARFNDLAFMLDPAYATATENLPTGAKRLYIATGTATFQTWNGASWVSAFATLTADITGNAATATSVAGGAAGQLLYQSGANTTGKLAAGNAGQMLVGGAGAPAWADYAPIVRGVLCTGMVTTDTTPVATSDTFLVALGKLQAQVSARLFAVGGLLQAYKEKNVAASAPADYEVNCSNGNIFTVTAMAPVTLSFTNVPAAPDHFSLTLYLKQDGTGGRTWTFPASVKWGANGAPEFSTTADAEDVITLTTRDGGANWFGFAAGLGY